MSLTSDKCSACSTTDKSIITLNDDQKQCFLNLFLSDVIDINDEVSLSICLCYHCNGLFNKTTRFMNMVLNTYLHSKGYHLQMQPPVSIFTIEKVNHIGVTFKSDKTTDDITETIVDVLHPVQKSCTDEINSDDVNCFDKSFEDFEFNNCETTVNDCISLTDGCQNAVDCLDRSGSLALSRDNNLDSQENDEMEIIRVKTIDEMKHNLNDNMELKGLEAIRLSLISRRNITQSNMYTETILSIEEAFELYKEQNNSRTYKLEYKCHYCMVGFYNENLLIDHNKLEHTKKITTELCYMCHRYIKNSQLIEHYKTHFVLYKCKVCSASGIYDAMSIRKHTIMCRKRVYKCHVCEQTFMTLNKMKYHKKKSHGQKKKCDICDKTFATYDSVKLHIERAHKNTTDVIKCDLCNKLFKQKRYYDVHMKRLHCGDRELDPDAFCYECKQQFASKYSLKHHLETSLQHKKRGSMLDCPLCDKKYNQPKHLKWHYDFMHLNVGDTCQLCGKLCKRPYGLRTHMNAVHSVRRRDFTCEHCGKAFYSRKLLNDHIRVHYDERPFQCDLCSATFKFKAALFSHKRFVHHKKKRNRRSPADGSNITIVDEGFCLQIDSAEI